MSIRQIKVAVIGCGAIGSLYAAHLARLPDVEVWAVDPWRDHMEAIERDGLTVTGAAEFTVTLHARSDASVLPSCDFGIVATKAVHTAKAMKAASHALVDAAVVSVQNGLGNEEVIAGYLPQVIRGSIVTAGTVTMPGTVRYDAPGDTYLGPFEPSPADLASIATLADMLTRSGLEAHALSDARGPQWTKVAFNAATSPLSALTGLTVGQVCTNPELRTQVDRLVAEALAVCAAQGIRLTRTPAESIREAIDEAFWHKPSMLQDVNARRPTEIDVINGGIASEGRRVGVPTLLHDAMVSLVHGLESSWDARPAGTRVAVDSVPGC